MKNLKISEGDQKPEPLETKKGLGFKGIILVIIISLIFGLIGGVGGTYFLLSKGGGLLRSILGGDETDPSIPTTVNEKLKLIGDYEFKGSINVRHVAEVLGYEIGPWGIEDVIVRKVNAKVAVHYGCHFLKPTRIREIESSEGPTIIEEFVEALGIESVRFKEQLTCCGAGGGVKAYDGTASMAIFGEKMKNIDEVKPDFILDICPFCHLQYETGQD